MEINYLELQKKRFINNGLVNRFQDIDTCVESLIGIQSQYQTHALISILNRVENFKAEQAFDSDHLIKSWGQRSTLHIYHKSDYHLISNLYIETESGIVKYAKELGVNLDDCMEDVRNCFSEKNNIVTKIDIENALKTEYAKELMVWSGLIIYGTYHKDLYGILNEKDLKLYKKNDIVNNNKEINTIFERYFTYYAPASIDDFLHWSGLKKRDIIEKLEPFLSNKSYYILDNKKYYYIKENDGEVDFPVVLGKFDPLLVSYRNKKWILEDKFPTDTIWKIAAQVNGAIVTEKGLVGTWHYVVKGSTVFYEVKSLRKINIKIKKKLENKFSEITNLLDKRKTEVLYE